MEDVDLLTPGVIEAGLMSIVRCPICSENLNAAFNQKHLYFGGEPWKPKACPEHPEARW